MRHRLFPLLAFVVWAGATAQSSAPATAAAGAPCFASDTEFNEWVTSYYANPNSEKLSCSLAYYADSSLYERVSTRMPVAHFHAALLRDAPGALDALFSSLAAASEHAKVMGLHVFWLTDDEPGRRLLDRARTEWSSAEIDRMAKAMLAEPPVDMLSAPVSNPFVIDALWAIFFATGNDEAVHRVATALPLADDGAGPAAALGSTAMQSLVRNARRHPRVLEIVTHLAREETGAVKEHLERIVAALESANGGQGS